MNRTCVATAGTPRAIVALVAPLVAIGAASFNLAGKGYSLSDYLALISTGEIGWFSQVIGWLCLVTWIARYFPPAFAAVWDGPCIVSADHRALFLPGGHIISLKSVREVTIHRGFFRKVAYIDRRQGRIAISLLFVRPSSDPLLRSLAINTTSSS